MPEPIRYTLKFPFAHQHYVEVTASYPAARKTAIDLMMPVWTPGSYLVREYAQHVEGFQSAGKWEKTRKNRWRVETKGAARVEVNYRVYGREMTVRHNFIDSSMALLNGAATYITLVDGLKRPHEVKLELPAAWKGSWTGLEEKGANEYRAADFDILVDSPILAGSANAYEFEAAGKKHWLVNEGEAGFWDGPASAQAVKKIVEEYQSMMGVVPYDKYVFLNLLVDQGGGIEHLNSTVLMGSRYAWNNTADAPEGAPRRPSRVSWLDLVSHEFFHLWNVKRLRPAELGPFDYENENYTRSLWVAEGVTTYYGPLMVKRAGLMKRDQYLRDLSRTISDLQTTPGRLAMPLETASFDAWIKLYRPNENSRNTAISYYTKGAVVTFLIDARIRQATDGAKTFDDLLRAAYQRFSGAKGFTPAQFRALISEVAGKDLSGWLEPMLTTTEELDYTPALEWFGLRFKKDATAGKAALGVTTKVDNGRLLISNVPRQTAAHASGLNVDDEILAVGKMRATSDNLATLVGANPPGATVTVMISRRGQIQEIPVKLIAEERKQWTLEPMPNATPEQKEHLKLWLRD